MLVAHVAFTVSPDARQTALDVLMSEVPVVRRMTGCLAFVPFADLTAPGGLGIVHEWETAEAFGRYVASPGFAAINAQLRPLMTGAPVSRRFEASLIEAVN